MILISTTRIGPNDLHAHSVNPDDPTITAPDATGHHHHIPPGVTLTTTAKSKSKILHTHGVYDT